MDTLSRPGPFSVFTPTYAAFARLPEGTVEDLLKPENKDKLVAILAYHVVPATAKAKNAVSLSDAKTINGKAAQITVKEGTVMVDGAKVVKTDITSNHIHASAESTSPIARKTAAKNTMRPITTGLRNALIASGQPPAQPQASDARPGTRILANTLG